MNANQIINMVVRMVMRRVLRSGVNMGMDALGKRMNRDKDQAGQHSQGSPDSRETVKRAKQTMRATRRLNKF